MADGRINPKTGKAKSKPKGHKPGQFGIRARGKRGTIPHSSLPRKKP